MQKYLNSTSSYSWITQRQEKDESAAWSVALTGGWLCDEFRCTRVFFQELQVSFSLYVIQCRSPYQEIWITSLTIRMIRSVDSELDANELKNHSQVPGFDGAKLGMIIHWVQAY